MAGITLVDLPVGGSQEEGGGWLPYVCSGAIAEQLCTSNHVVANRFPLLLALAVNMPIISRNQAIVQSENVGKCRQFGNPKMPI